MPGATFLEGHRVTLRTVEEEDLEFIRDGVNHPSVRSPVGQVFPTNLPLERRYFEEANASDAVQTLVTVNGKRVGQAELDPVDYEQGVAELAFWLLPEHRGTGYAREAAALLVGYAFDELRLHRVGATVFDTNPRSKHLLTELGFVEEGVQRESAFFDGAYHDTHMLGVLAGEWAGNASGESGGDAPPESAD